jgi:Holliday junction resolvase
MGRMSKQKGKRGEREAAKALSEVLQCSARRGVQFQGGPDSPDVVTDIPDTHIEVKRTERFQMWPALNQAKEDANGKTPLVLTRQNGKDWVLVMELSNLPNLLKSINSMQIEK